MPQQPRVDPVLAQKIRAELLEADPETLDPELQNLLADFRAHAQASAQNSAQKEALTKQIAAVEENRTRFEGICDYIMDTMVKKRLLSLAKPPVTPEVNPQQERTGPAKTPQQVAETADKALQEAVGGQQADTVAPGLPKPDGGTVQVSDQAKKVHDIAEGRGHHHKAEASAPNG